jgi:transcriptional regulator with XRE-family HTH domain
MDLGGTINKYRKQAGLSQEELANKLNVTRQSVSLWETNQSQPSLENLKSLSRIFNITLDQLCGNDSEDNSKNISIIKDDKAASKTSNKENSKIKKILILFFVLSLVSIVIALLILAISRSLSPLPEFPYSTPEHMWKFYLVLHIPLTSFVLGIIYLIKGYKCKKNIIAGAIMSVVLAIYGSFSSIFSDTISHDKAYLDNISELMNFDFPNSDYISITYDYNQNCESLAMAKINENEADSFIEKLDKNGYFHKDVSFIPSNVLDIYTLSLTTDYEYFTVYNLTTNSYNDFDGKLIYVAYDIDKSILFICCYK